MNTHSLNGNWKLKIIGKDEGLTPDMGIDARVPGSVYGALLGEHLIDDPYYRDNELKILPLMDNDFEYTTSFNVTSEMMSADGLILRFDGVDTLADVYVNGEKLGHLENMHRFYEFDLTCDELPDLVQIGDNELKVHIYSPTLYIKEENAKSYTGGPQECMEGFAHLRKAHCMFGWDWGPRIPDAGIFRDVSILEINQARIDSVYISQTHNWDDKDIAYSGTTDIPPSTVTLDFNIETEIFSNDDDLTVNIIVFSPTGQIYTQESEQYRVVVTEPELWWPNGYGAQPLYKVEISLSNYKHELLDKKTYRIGLRTMKMNTEKDEWGERFAHEINGKLIFAMGADYIPEDNLLSRVTPSKTRMLLEDAVLANHNCIRVWGGGYYLDDFFYDICDELGLVVWQDFMYACASYDLTEEFEANIMEETRQVVRRLRNHACLGLWCGNNELEAQVIDGAWKHSPRQKADYTKMYEYILPKIVKEEDPDRFYWPSSPSSGGAWDNPCDENRGDMHYWDVWHGEKPFTDYRNYYFRYLSEFGFQSFPSKVTVESFTEPEDRNIFSYVMEMHQRNASANGKILKYISATYKYPKDFDSVMFASQLLQADAIRYGVEHFRRNRGRCMGTVVWQLNDIWPVASWSSIDYFGRWKALHYAEKRMFSPIMISCEETGELTQKPFVTQEPKKIKVGARLHVANESRTSIKGTVFWNLRNEKSEILKSGSEDVFIKPMDGVWLEYMDFDEYDTHSVHLEYSFGSGAVTYSQNTVLFTPPKHYNFEDPKLSLEVKGDYIIIRSEAYAKNVAVEGIDGDAVLSDNYFDMEKGEVKVKMIRANATMFRVRSVYDIDR